MDSFDPIVNLNLAEQRFDPLAEEIETPAGQDFITIISAADGKMLTKRHRADGTTIPYNKGYLFTSRKVPINSLDDLAAALDCPPDSAVILGRNIEWSTPEQPHRRLLHNDPKTGDLANYEPAAHAYAILDIDEKETPVAWLRDIPGTVARVIRDWLPPDLHGADCVWRLTGSAGIKPGIRLRLAFLLDRTVTGAELRAWFTDCPNVDAKVFNPVQLIYGSPVFDAGDTIKGPRSGIIRGGKQRATPPADLAERMAAKQEFAKSVGWQQGNPTALDEIRDMFATIPAPDDYDLIWRLAGSVAAMNAPEDPGMEERCAHFMDWANSGSVDDNDGQEFETAFWRAAKPMDKISAGTLIWMAQQHGYELPSKIPEPAGDFTKKFGVVAGRIARLEAAKASRNPALLWADDPVGYTPETGWDDLLGVEGTFMGPITAGSEEGKAMLDELIAKCGGVAPERQKNRFRWSDPEEDANRKPLTYWDDDKTLPRISGGCVGMAIGEPGSHKTGLFIMRGLDAIERKGGRVLYIAAEGADGIKGARLPKAREARDMPWTVLKAGWATEAETFRLLDPADHQLLFDEYRDFAPNLIFIDVLTMVAEGDINTPMVGGAIMKAAHALAHKFGATLLIAHHPGKDPTKGAAGSFAFKALADFMWKVWEADNTVWVRVEKMKDGPDDHSHCYVADMALGAPVIRARNVTEVMAGRAASEHPVGVAIKSILDGGAEFDMGGLIDELVSRPGSLPPGIKHPRKLVAALVADGQLEGYVETHGKGAGTRHTFKRIEK